MSVSHASCSHDRTPKGRAACRAAAKRGAQAPQPVADAPEPVAAPVPTPDPEPTPEAPVKPVPVGTKVDGFARVRDWATVARDGGLPVEQTMDGDGGTEIIISSPNGTSGKLRIRYTSADRRTTVTRTVPDNPSKPVKVADVNALVNSWVHAQA